MFPHKCCGTKNSLAVSDISPLRANLWMRRVTGTSYTNFKYGWIEQLKRQHQALMIPFSWVLTWFSSFRLWPLTTHSLILSCKQGRWDTEKCWTRRIRAGLGLKPYWVCPKRPIQHSLRVLPPCVPALPCSSVPSDLFVNYQFFENSAQCVP